MERSIDKKIKKYKGTEATVHINHLDLSEWCSTRVHCAIDRYIVIDVSVELLETTNNHKNIKRKASDGSDGLS